MSSAEDQTQGFPVRGTAEPGSRPPPDAGAQRPRASRRSRLVTGVLVLLGLGLFALGVGARLADVHFNTVVSNSMQPTFSAGDLVVTRPIPVDAIRQGDVIAFFPPGYTQPVMHRVTSFVDGVMTTRGDANSVADPWRLTPNAGVAYRLLMVIPYAGWLSQLQVPLLLLALLLAALSIAQVLWKEVVKRRVPQPKPIS